MVNFEGAAFVVTSAGTRTIVAGTIGIRRAAALIRAKTEGLFPRSGLSSCAPDPASRFGGTHPRTMAIYAAR